MSTKTFTQIVSYKHTPKTMRVCLFFWLFLLGLSFTLGSAPTFAVSADFTTSYSSEDNINPGTLVSISDKDKTKIEPTTKSNAANYIGVLVKNDDSTLAVNTSLSQGQVATTGKVITLVSNEAGEIMKGDLLAVSQIKGVASKTNSENSQVVGVAMQNFDVKSAKNTEVNIKIPGNTKSSFTVGPIEMQIFVIKKSPGATKPGVIVWIEDVSGKPVSMTKFIIIFGLIMVVLASITAMAYSAIRNTIVQSSRNPLAKPVIASTLLRVVIVISAVAVAGYALIYAILKA